MVRPVRAAPGAGVRRAHLDDAEDAGLCPTCQRRWSEVDGGATWLHVEVTRAVDDDLASWDADFCSQEHAVHWLSRPLSALVPLEPLQSSWRDRLLDVGVLLLCLLTGVMACVGVATLAWIGLDD